MCNNVIHLHGLAVQRVGGLLHFPDGRHFLLPPAHAAAGANIRIGTESAAHGEHRLSLYLKYLSPAEVKDVVVDIVDFAPAPLILGIAVQFVEIFVAAVNKQNLILLSTHELKDFLLLTVSVPDKAEISANDQNISAAQLGKLFFLKT